MIEITSGGAIDMARNLPQITACPPGWGQMTIPGCDALRVADQLAYHAQLLRWRDPGVSGRPSRRGGGRPWQGLPYQQERCQCV